MNTLSVLLALVAVIFFFLRKSFSQQNCRPTERTIEPISLCTGDARSNSTDVCQKPPMPIHTGHEPSKRDIGQSIDLSFPEPSVPEGKSIRKVIGSLGDPYTVNLTTCPDFAIRSSCARNSMSRLCKHQMHQLQRLGAFDGMSKWHQSIAMSGHGGPITAKIVERTESPAVLLSVGGNAEWINVYAHTKRKGETIASASGRIEEFGWSVVENRWSYGDGPPGARELRKLLTSLKKENLRDMINNSNTMSLT